MPVHPGLRAAAVLAAAAVLVHRWRTTRAPRDAPDAGPDPGPDGTTDTGRDRVAELHASFLDPSLRETDAHLEQYWNRLTALYLHRDGDGRKD